MWDVNTRECWLFDLIDFKLQGNSGLCYRSIRMLETHWGFDSDNDDIDFLYNKTYARTSKENTRRRKNEKKRKKI